MLKKYIFWIIIITIFVLLGVKDEYSEMFFDSMENKTFDIRQSVLAANGIKKHNEDIVIVAIDDASYEYVLDKYGEWPLRRDIYAKLTRHIEQQKPKSIAFDLMFVKSIKSTQSADNELINTFKDFDNIYTAINLDYQESEIRTPEKLPEKFAIKIKNNSTKINPDYFEFSNCRTILEGIMDATENIGVINVLRGNDGILRQMPLFYRYQNKYYPQLGFKVALDYLGLKDKKEFEIDKHGYLILDESRKIPLNPDGTAILNWYGNAETFKYIPLYELIEEVENNKTGKIFDFHNKIVYFGATASSLFDIKTVPVDKVYPGVEVQTTYVNNLIDGNIINKIPKPAKIIINLALAIIIISLVLFISSMTMAIFLSILVNVIYIAFTYYAMLAWNLWFPLISPTSFAIFAFILAVIFKYLIKSRDFDEQYKLATTDGLTDLYNHRYFQEQMQQHCQNSQRYNNELSLIILDIDFFKNFNDNFGHQSGDAVLRQVANILKKNVRSTDIVCRYGGEEISIILPNSSKEEAISTAQKLCNIIAEYKFKLNNNKESHVTISLGVSTFGTDKDGITPSQLIETADKRLYNAKNNGRNRVN